MKHLKQFKFISLFGIFFLILGMVIPYIYAPGVVYSWEEKDLQSLSLFKFTMKRSEYNLDDAGMYIFFIVLLSIFTILALVMILLNKPILIIISALLNQAVIMLISSDLKDSGIVGKGRYGFTAGYYVHLIGFITVIICGLCILIGKRRNRNEKNEQ